MGSSVHFLNSPSFQEVIWVNQVKALGIKYSLAWACEFTVHGSLFSDTTEIILSWTSQRYFLIQALWKFPHACKHPKYFGNFLHSGYSPDCSIKGVLIKFISTAPWHLRAIKPQYSCEISMCYYLFITEGEARKLSSLCDVPGEGLQQS